MGETLSSPIVQHYRRLPDASTHALCVDAVNRFDLAQQARQRALPLKKRAIRTDPRHQAQ